MLFNVCGSPNLKSSAGLEPGICRPKGRRYIQTQTLRRERIVEFNGGEVASGSLANVRGTRYNRICSPDP